MGQDISGLDPLFDGHVEEFPRQQSRTLSVAAGDRRREGKAARRDAVGH
jgi:hypothetical protein